MRSQSNETIEQWIPEFFVTFDSAGGSEIGQIFIVSSKQKFQDLPSPSANWLNFTFNGWWDDEKEYIEGPEYKIDRDITLVAQWKTTISFDYNGATEENNVKNVTVVYSKNIPALPKPVKKGYKFVGWFLNDVQYFEGDIFKNLRAIELKARWLVEITYI